MDNLAFISLFGGICILLYGIQITSEGLKLALSGKIRSIIGNLTDNKFVGLGIGALVTFLLQSSTSTTVILVSFVGSGVMSFSQSIAVILGADIGTTFTIQLLSLNILDYALLLIGVGFCMMFFSKQKKFQYIGQVILGFGFLFLSLKIMKEATAPLQRSSEFQLILKYFSDNPFWLLVISALFTGLVHSSAAILAFAISLSHDGALNIYSALPIIIGANIGTCITAYMSGLGSTTDAKRVAVAHVLFKVLGAVVLYPFMKPFADFILIFSGDVPRQIANAHTIFNILITLLVFPFIPLFAKLIIKLIPEKEEKKEKIFRPKFIDDKFLVNPALALGQVIREVSRMACIVEEMLVRSIEVFKHNDIELAEQIQEMDDKLDILEEALILYTAKISQNSITETQSNKLISLMHVVNDLENIGDIIDKNLMELAKKKIKNGLSFSTQGQKEIEDIHYKVCENLYLAVDSLVTGEKGMVKKVLSHDKKISELQRESYQTHLNRLRDGYQESIDTSAIHLDMLTNLQRINSHATSIGYAVLGLLESTGEAKILEPSMLELHSCKEEDSMTFSSRKTKEELKQDSKKHSTIQKTQENTTIFE